MFSISLYIWVEYALLIWDSSSLEQNVAGDLVNSYLGTHFCFVVKLNTRVEGNGTMNCLDYSNGKSSSVLTAKSI